MYRRLSRSRERGWRSTRRLLLKVKDVLRRNEYRKSASQEGYKPSQRQTSVVPALQRIVHNLFEFVGKACAEQRTLAKHLRVPSRSN